ncbi:MAG: hypothetical protein U9Q81_21430 [Pseudomonadota bacterium]|nr:hypothetical protein [Pseudomonadota bacterium]
MHNMRMSTKHDRFDVDFPLHPATSSAEDVSRLVSNILNDIDAYTGNGSSVSQSDVLQALAIATAVHVAKADASEKAGVEFSLELLDVAVDSLGRGLSSGATTA